MASMAVAIDPYAVIITTATSGSSSLTWFKKSRPLIPSILISTSKISKREFFNIRKASSPLAARATSWPSRSSQPDKTLA